MKKHEIVVGGRYWAKVSGQMVVVRVDRIEEVDGRTYGTALGTTSRIKGETRYHCVNEATGRKVVFKSAAKFRKPAAETAPKVKPPMREGLPGEDGGRKMPATNFHDQQRAAGDARLLKDLGLGEQPDEIDVGSRRFRKTAQVHDEAAYDEVPSAPEEDRCPYTSDGLHVYLPTKDGGSSSRCNICAANERLTAVDPTTKRFDTDPEPKVLADMAEHAEWKRKNAQAVKDWNDKDAEMLEGEQRSDPSTASAAPSVGRSTSAPTEEGEQRPNPTPAAMARTTHAPTETVPGRSATAVSSLADRLRAADRRYVPGATVAGYAPTEEQAAVLEAAGRNGLTCLVIGAGAGAGKTSTLRMLEEVLPGRGQYTAFNASLVAESKAKFKRAQCNTTHSLAFRAVGRRYAHRLGGQRVRSDAVARMLGIGDFTVEMPPDPDAKPDADGAVQPKRKVLAAGFLASQVTGAIRKFCQSAERAVDRKHFKLIAGIDSPELLDGRRDYRNNRRVQEYLLPYAEAAWKDLSDPDGKLPFTHDHYVKVWQLGQGQDTPVIQADYLLCDEAQDLSEVFLDVLKRQSCLLILVGDENQQIYEWRGAVNAMAAFPDAPRCLLSQSFRFGQAVADVANSILATLDAPTDLVMRGLEAIPSIVVSEPPEDGSSTRGHDAVLCRTNACAVGHVLRAFAEGQRPHLVGGGADVVSFVKAARDLQAGRPTGHMDLCCFESWKEVQEYVKTDDGDDLKLLVKLIDEFGCEPILEALEHMPAEADADLVVCTSHKSKGREWGRVKLAADFPPAARMTDPDRRLLYVAATRAQHVLDVSECPPFQWTKDKQSGEEVAPIVVTYTAPMPTEDDLTAYLSGKAEEKAKVKIDRYGETGTAGPVTSSAPAQAVNGDGRPEFTWSQFGGEWLVRGPAGRTGAVTVTRKSGLTTVERLGEVVREFPEATLYRVRK